MWNLNIKETFTKVKDWDKAWAKKIQDKFNLTDYQMLCLAFAKGFIIGAILLWFDGLPKYYYQVIDYKRLNLCVHPIYGKMRNLNVRLYLGHPIFAN